MRSAAGGNTIAGKRVPMFRHRGEQMLVLSRRERENIRLGDDIVVTVVKITGDKVRLGVEAPPSVLVLRGELDRRAAVGLPVQGGVEKNDRNEDLPATD